MCLFVLIGGTLLTLPAKPDLMDLVLEPTLVELAPKRLGLSCLRGGA